MNVCGLTEAKITKLLTIDDNLYDRNIDKLSPLSISENDELRSHFMWDLIQSSKRAPFEVDGVTIPRQIIQFWDDINAIPPDVKSCIDSWESCENNGFKRILFDDNSARNFIMSNFGHHYVEAFEYCRHPAMRSDYFRLCYIYKNGGFYVDADDVYKGFDITPWFNDSKLKIQSLCYDTSTDLMVKAEDFITPDKYFPSLIYYVNNDPLIAPPNHPIIHIALERSTKMLLESSGNTRDIQSTTGPGNLTASLVRHVLESESTGNIQDFLLINNWNEVSDPQWTLEYRKDKRNWRIWDGSNL